MSRALLSTIWSIVGTLTLSLGVLGLGFIPFSGAIAPPAYASVLPPSPISTLPGLGKTFAGKPPQDLGWRDQHFQVCPNTPNCVSSLASDEVHYVAPIVYQSDRETARRLLLKVLSVVPRTEIITDTPDYIRTEFTTNLLGFVDDGEFYFPENQPLIQVRSASRLGESDLDLNRRRIEQIRLALKDLRA